jgi:hypothetical protein
MQISREILEYTFGLLVTHQPAFIDGEYDGKNGVVTMTFVGDSNTYQLEFEYLGSSYNEFREKVIQTAGQLVADHNTAVGIPSRQPFIDSVTE